MSWHFVDENTYKDEEGVHERGTRDGSSLATLCSTHRVELHHWFLGIVLLEIKGHALLLESWALSGSCAPSTTGRVIEPPQK
jgi:hypothetical protein